jgi:predicted small integral membrane protein
VAVFFSLIAVLLAGMTLWELRAPTIARKGFLPLRTTRGDRLFIGLLSVAYINLAWVGLSDLDQWYAVALGLLVLLLIMRKG